MTEPAPAAEPQPAELPPPSPEGNARGRRAPGLRARLGLLVLASVLPLVAHGLADTWFDYRAARAAAERRTLDLARALAVALDRELASLAVGLQVLAMSDSLEQGNLAEFRGEAEGFLAAIHPGKRLVLADATGQVLLSTAREAGAPLPPRRDLDSVRKVFATARPTVSDLYVGPLSGETVVSVDVPVFAEADGQRRVAYELALVVPLDVFASIVAAQRLPPGYVVSIFDSQGVNVARVPNPDRRFTGVAANLPLRMQLLAGETEGVVAAETLESIPAIIGFVRPEGWGWSAAVGLPRAEFEAPLRRDALLTLAAGAAALLVGLILAGLIGARVAGPIGALRRLAGVTLGAIPAREGKTEETHRLREAEEVAQALRRVADERGAAEAAWRASEAYFRALAEAIPQLAWSTDATGQADWFNGRWWAYTGATPETCLGEGWADWVHPADRAHVLATWQAAIASGAPYGVEFRLRGVDGFHRWFLVRGLRLAEGGRWFGTCTDISELVAAREVLARQGEALERLVAERTAELARSETAYRRLFEDAPAPMHTADPEGRLLQVSDEWMRLLGHSREEVLGRPLGELMDAPSAARYRAVAWPDPPEGGDEVREGEYRVLARAGAVVDVLLRERPERDADGRVTRRLGVLVDLTERNRAESWLRQAQKMEAVGQLTGGVAHDFNNLLQVVIGNLQLLDRQLPQGPAGDRFRHSLARAVEAAERGGRLTGQLLAFARRGHLAPEPVDVNARLRGPTGTLIEQALNGRARLALELQEDLWPALADPTQLDVALLNLAVNARDAMEGQEKGLLTVETAAVRLQPGDRLLAELGPAGSRDGEEEPLAPGDYVLLAVTDTGAGMSPDTLTRAMEPFFTTKEVGKGTGLGLSQVHGFARQSGGAVRIQSHPREGTTVHLYLPRALPDMHAAAPGRPEPVHGGA